NVWQPGVFQPALRCLAIAEPPDCVHCSMRFYAVDQCRFSWQYHPLIGRGALLVRVPCQPGSKGMFVWTAGSSVVHILSIRCLFVNRASRSSVESLFARR